MRYSLLAGGKRVRPVLCLATAEGFGCAAERRAADRARARARAHVLARPRRSARRSTTTTCGAAGRRRTCASARTSPCSRATHCSTTPSRSSATARPARTPPRGGAARARLGGRSARHDRRPVPRRAPRRRRSTRAASSAPRASRRARCSERPPPAARSSPGADASGVDTARAFGAELGLLFQIVDDVLDETGSNEALGKSGGHRRAPRPPHVRERARPARRPRARGARASGRPAGCWPSSRRPRTARWGRS